MSPSFFHLPGQCLRSRSPGIVIFHTVTTVLGGRRYDTNNAHERRIDSQFIEALFRFNSPRIALAHEIGTDDVV